MREFRANRCFENVKYKCKSVLFLNFSRSLLDARTLDMDAASQKSALAASKPAAKPPPAASPFAKHEGSTVLPPAAGRGSSHEGQAQKPKTCADMSVKDLIEAISSTDEFKEMVEEKVEEKFKEMREREGGEEEEVICEGLTVARDVRLGVVAATVRLSHARAN